jgi:hypothetical protein
MAGEYFFAGNGADTCDGGGGDDGIFGGPGNDTITAGGGSDYVDGGPGDDGVAGGADGDELYGGNGDDAVCSGSGTNDRVHGGPPERGRGPHWHQRRPAVGQAGRDHPGRLRGGEQRELRGHRRGLRRLERRGVRQLALLHLQPHHPPGGLPRALTARGR